jgi:putative transcriptional regulator
MNKTKSNLFFEDLKTSLEVGMLFAKGKLKLRTTVVPLPPPEIGPEDVIQLRERCQLSQQIFAKILNGSTKTVQSWEQGKHRPTQAALRLLQVLRGHPEMILKLMGNQGPIVSVSP